MFLEKTMTIIEQDKNMYSQGSRMPYFPLVVDSGKGAIITDIDGNEFIDFLASAGASNTGHAHPVVVNAIKAQAEKIVQYTSAYMYNEPMVKLSQKLIEITPGDFPKRVVFGLSGSDANDGMIKAVRAYTGRSKIISFAGAYHGSTYGALSLSALSLNMRRKIGPLLPDIFHFEFPDCYRCPHGQVKENCSMECLKTIKRAFANYLPPDEVAAIVLEPIAGDAGLIVPPESFVKGLDEICKTHGILLVAEEVQQGFGRTGKWFSIEHFGIEPDVIVMGKSIASGMPLSALVTRSEIIGSLEKPAHLFTMSGHSLSCEAALASIQVIEDEKLMKNADELGEYIKSRFEQLALKFDFIGEIRGKGLSVGVDLVIDQESRERNTDAAAKICYRCWEKGLILIFLAGNVLRIQPPLVISKNEVDQALAIIEEAMEEYVSGLISDDVLQVAQGW
jgi:4-aminobutyrate aminotransferase